MSDRQNTSVSPGSETVTTAVQPTISVIGTGYLGATHAAAMAALGMPVIGLDTDVNKVNNLAAGKVPFFEPGLPELLRKHVDSAACSIHDGLRRRGSACRLGNPSAVGTPQRKAGNSRRLS